MEDLNSPKVGTYAKKPASAGDGKQHLPVVYPEIQLGGDDESSQELWRLLVVRERVRSTLAMEGVIGPTSRTIRVKQRRSVLSAAEIDGHVSTVSPVKTGRIADNALTVGATPESEGSEGRCVPEFQKPEVMFSLMASLLRVSCISICTRVDHAPRLLNRCWSKVTGPEVAGPEQCPLQGLV